MYIDYKEFKSIFTPFTVVSFPIVMIVLYAESIGRLRGYYSITLDTYTFLIFNFFLLWLPGQLVFFANSGNIKGIGEFENIEIFIQKFGLILLFFLWIAILSAFLDLFSFIRQYGIYIVTTETFEKNYGRGILGHLTLLGYPSFILLASYVPPNINKKVTLISLFLMAFVIFVSQIKYHLILPLITIFILKFFITKDKIKAYRNLVIAGILISLIFAMTYFFTFTIAYGYSEALSSIGFILKHFEHYIVSGPLALSKLLSDYRNIFSIKDLFVPLINIYQWLIGDEIYTTASRIELWIAISETDSTNVGTMFAAIYLALGYHGTLFFSLMIGIISYLIYYVAIRTRKVRWVLLNCWLMSILILSFFSYYFNLLLIWEVAFYSWIIPILSSAFNQIFYFTKNQKGKF